MQRTTRFVPTLTKVGHNIYNLYYVVSPTNAGGSKVGYKGTFGINCINGRWWCTIKSQLQPTSQRVMVNEEYDLPIINNGSYGLSK